LHGRRSSDTRRTGPAPPVAAVNLPAVRPRPQIGWGRGRRGGCPRRRTFGLQGL